MPCACIAVVIDLAHNNMACLVALMPQGKPASTVAHELIVLKLVALAGTLSSCATLDTRLPWGIRRSHGMLQATMRCSEHSLRLLQSVVAHHSAGTRVIVIRPVCARYRGCTNPTAVNAVHVQVSVQVVHSPVYLDCFVSSKDKLVYAFPTAF